MSVGGVLAVLRGYIGFWEDTAPGCWDKVDSLYHSMPFPASAFTARINEYSGYEEYFLRYIGLVYEIVYARLCVRRKLASLQHGPMKRSVLQTLICCVFQGPKQNEQGLGFRGP